MKSLLLISLISLSIASNVYANNKLVSTIKLVKESIHTANEKLETNTTKNTDIEITKIKYEPNKEKSSTIQIVFANYLNNDITDIKFRLKFPSKGNYGGINTDFSTKNDTQGFKLKALDYLIYNWNFKSSTSGDFSIAITGYKTNDKEYKIENDNLKWFDFYYPAEENLKSFTILDSSNTKDISVIQDYNYSIMNLSAGDTCTAHLKWSGDGEVSLAYAEGGFDTDNNEIVTSTQFKNRENYFEYKFKNDEVCSFTVPYDGIYVIPVITYKNNSKPSDIRGVFVSPAP